MTSATRTSSHVGECSLWGFETTAASRPHFLHTQILKDLGGAVRGALNDKATDMGYMTFSVFFQEWEDERDLRTIRSCYTE
jgi:hypothetical protein